ncbi:DUF4998 domain-containing protein [Fulvivirgaceae bacterium BMA12]|uniref:DUF4998 domain-containing protein n=1 Tax=Agaribacillus aureus TaxID=3051825 RepID=A0ABT8LFW6_9BACT|nr:DUF4998 domain-containing protein [Fulvivirgaceae bacterium BMA12]
MKNFNISRIMLLGFVALWAGACQSEQDTFDEFVLNGENVVVGAVQDVKISHGVGKLKLEIALSGDPKIKKIIVNDGDTEVKTLDIVRNKDGKDTVSYTLDLEEKLYNFFIHTVDDAGNKSLPYEFVATVFADKYIKNLSSRKVTEVSFDAAGASSTISLGDPFERMNETTLTYADRDGVNQIISIPNEDNAVVIDDYAGGGKFQISSSYKPPLQEGESYFEDFLSKEVHEDNFPDCIAEANAALSATSFDFGQYNKDENSTVESFTVQSDDCIDGAVTVKTSAPFEVALVMDGPFDSSVAIDEITVAQTVYVRFSPASGKNQVFTGQIIVEAGAITTTPSIDLAGEEIGNLKSGLHILGPDEAGAFTTVDLPNDAFAHAWGGLWHEALFDGNQGTHGHTDHGFTPGHFTVDLGKDYVITKVGWKHRSGQHGRGLKRYQVWGLPGNMDVNAAATTKLIGDSESEWSKEMAQNGWTSLVNASLDSNPPESEGKTHDVSGFVYVRYIRVAVMESFHSESFFNFGELELTADFNQ